MAGTGRLRVNKLYAANCLRCADYEDMDAHSYRDAEIALRKTGWKKQDGKWICPRCLKKEKP